MFILHCFPKFLPLTSKFICLLRNIFKNGNMIKSNSRECCGLLFDSWLWIIFHWSWLLLYIVCYVSMIRMYFYDFNTGFFCVCVCVFICIVDRWCRKSIHLYVVFLGYYIVGWWLSPSWFISDKFRLSHQPKYLSRYNNSLELCGARLHSCFWLFFYCSCIYCMHVCNFKIWTQANNAWVCVF